MKPVPFDQVNKTFTAPPGMEETVLPSPVWQGRDNDEQPQIISCWELSKEEIIHVANTGRVWLAIMASGMPPVSVMAESPFDESERIEKKREVVTLSITMGGDYGDAAVTLLLKLFAETFNKRIEILPPTEDFVNREETDETSKLVWKYLGFQVSICVLRKSLSFQAEYSIQYVEL